MFEDVEMLLLFYILVMTTTKAAAANYETTSGISADYPQSNAADDLSSDLSETIATENTVFRALFQTNPIVRNMHTTHAVNSESNATQRNHQSYGMEISSIEAAENRQNDETSFHTPPQQIINKDLLIRLNPAAPSHRDTNVCEASPLRLFRPIFGALSVDDAIQRIKNQDTSDAVHILLSQNYECPICREAVSNGDIVRRICTESRGNHWICQNCCEHNKFPYDSCPTCRGVEAGQIFIARRATFEN